MFTDNNVQLFSTSATLEFKQRIFIFQKDRLYTDFCTFLRKFAKVTVGKLIL